MEIAGRYFNSSCLRIFQKSLRALFHSPIVVEGLLVSDTWQLLNETEWDMKNSTDQGGCYPEAEGRGG